MVTLIEATGLSFCFPGRHRSRAYAVEEVSFTAGAGQLIFLLGPNGSGKSTLFRLLLGHLRPTRGTVAVAGMATAGLPARELARRIAYVPQSEPAAFDFTARDVALMGRTPHLARFGQRPTRKDVDAAEAALDWLGITALSDVGIRSMSGGERQLVFLARALCQESRIVILDEPTSALDFANQTRVLGRLERLAREGYLLIVSSHNPQHALTHADRVLLLKRGRLVGDSSPADLTEAALSDLYETPLLLREAKDAPGFRLCMPDREGGPYA